MYIQETLIGLDRVCVYVCVYQTIITLEEVMNSRRGLEVEHGRNWKGEREELK